jgi:hypothetical protein
LSIWVWVLGMGFFEYLGMSLGMGVGFFEYLGVGLGLGIKTHTQTQFTQNTHLI